MTLSDEELEEMSEADLEWKLAEIEEQIEKLETAQRLAEDEIEAIELILDFFDYRDGGDGR